MVVLFTEFVKLSVGVREQQRLEIRKKSPTRISFLLSERSVHTQFSRPNFHTWGTALLLLRLHTHTQGQQ